MLFSRPAVHSDSEPGGRAPAMIVNQGVSLEPLPKLPVESVAGVVNATDVNPPGGGRSSRR